MREPATAVQLRELILCLNTALDKLRKSTTIKKAMSAPDLPPRYRLSNLILILDPDHRAATLANIIRENPAGGPALLNLASRRERHLSMAHALGSPSVGEYLTCTWVRVGWSQQQSR